MNYEKIVLFSQRYLELVDHLLGFIRDSIKDHPVYGYFDNPSLAKILSEDYEYIYGFRFKDGIFQNLLEGKSVDKYFIGKPEIKENGEIHLSYNYKYKGELGLL